MPEGLNEIARSLRERFERAGQGHVFRWWDSLPESGRRKLVRRLNSTDLDLLSELVDRLVRRGERPVQRAGRLEKPEVIDATSERKQDHVEAVAAAERYVRQGKVAALVVAGGQGTRLGYPRPKGTYPIMPISGASLFEWHAAKIAASARKYGAEIPWYVMTSETNHRATRDFFKKHNYFGLGDRNVFFFKQGVMPAVDLNGKLLMASRYDLAVSPNGHGGCLYALRDSGALQDMERRGIELISYFQVDNPLITPIDLIFIGYHILRNADMSLKVVQKRDLDEGLGVVCLLDGKPVVIEYSDLTEEEKKATFEFGTGSIAAHVFSLDFVKKLVYGDLRLPFHVAHKKVPHIDENGRKIVPNEKNGYKFEMFIFDALPFAERYACVKVDRRNEFSPLKNAEGPDSPSTVRRDLCNLFARWLSESGASIPVDPDGNTTALIEIWPQYADCPEDLSKRIPPRFVCQSRLLIA